APALLGGTLGDLHPGVAAVGRELDVARALTGVDRQLRPRVGLGLLLLSLAPFGALAQNLHQRTLLVAQHTLAVAQARLGAIGGDVGELLEAWPVALETHDEQVAVLYERHGRVVACPSGAAFVGVGLRQARGLAALAVVDHDIAAVGGEQTAAGAVPAAVRRRRGLRFLV